MTLDLYEKRGDYLVAHGREPIFDSDFVLRQTRPTPANVAVPGGTVLRTAAQLGLPTEPNGDIIITDAYHAANKTNGVLTITGLDLFGFVKIRTRYDVELRQSRVRGSGPVTGLTRTGLIDCNSPELGLAGRENVLVEECLLVPDFPSEGIDGIVGHDYTLSRSRLRYCVDHAGIFNRFRPSDPARVSIEGIYADELVYLSPCTYQDDDRTHNDGVQIQGNTGWRIIGSDIRANPAQAVGNGYDPNDPTAPAKNPYGPSSVTGQAIGITPNVSAVRDGEIADNWISAGRASLIALARLGVSNVSLLRNVFDRTQPDLISPTTGIRARRAVILEPGVAFPGISSSTGPDLTNGNVHPDGQLITIYREAG